LSNLWWQIQILHVLHCSLIFYTQETFLREYILIKSYLPSCLLDIQYRSCLVPGHSPPRHKVWPPRISKRVFGSWLDVSSHRFHSSFFCRKLGGRFHRRKLGGAATAVRRVMAGSQTTPKASSYCLFIDQHYTSIYGIQSWKFDFHCNMIFFYNHNLGFFSCSESHNAFVISLDHILILECNTRNYSAWVHSTSVVVEYPTRI
jgi:hypothetical protein